MQDAIICRVICYIIAYALYIAIFCMEYLALDLGAGSGRAIVGIIEDRKIRLDEVHRFNNKPVKLGNTLYWDFLSLFDNIKKGIRLAQKKGYTLRGIAVDTWGVDFGLIDKKGNLLSNPVCYRDNRTIGISDEVSKYISKEDLYNSTGIQQIEINSLFQLFSLQYSDDPALSIVDKVLFMPDLVNFYLTGNAFNEYTIASTSQLLNARKRQWDEMVFKKLSLSSGWMQEIKHPCSVVGELKKDIAEETRVPNSKVFAVGSHDTASAIGAIPAEGKDWAFLSSGTWSLLGVTMDEPILTEEAMQSDFTNEGGIDNKILFMRNITGLWLLQQLITEWEREEELCSYEHLLAECSKTSAFRSIVNSDAPEFNHPSSMRKAIQDYCSESGQPIPETKGELVRCVLESLALKYRFVMDKLKSCTNKDIKKLFIVGGGSLNAILNQFIANALDMEVITGLTEATAIGNVIQQAIADKKISGLNEGHRIIKNSFNFISYLPQDVHQWADAAKEIKSKKIIE